LPPTNFFSASRSDDDNLFIEDDGEMVEYDLNADSLLSHASRNLPATLLGWHYRSREEALISFSNSAFYRGELLTIPDRVLPQEGAIELDVQSVEEAPLRVDDLLCRGISFHFMKTAIYEKRRNVVEAVYTAHLIRELLARETGQSIGIVAFSEAQQGEIENALARLGEEDTDFRNRLELEIEREEDGQFNGLFVKNLENVQGDERDIIILSICYGHDASGRMLMNFGPINQMGGEKRLNVIFSRARKHMVVVSSIRHHDITNAYNDGANCLRNYLEYAAAVSRGDRATAQRVLQNLCPARAAERRQHDRDTVVEEIRQALQQRGYVVDSSVGQSQFRCDLAVRLPQDSAYRLGILVDTVDHYANANLLERYLLRPGILTAFGWRVTFLLTKDWLHTPDDVLQRLENLLTDNGIGETADNADNPAHGLLEVTPASSITEPAEVGEDAIAQDTALLTPAGEPEHQLQFASTAEEPNSLGAVNSRYLECRQDGSSKFWTVTVDGQHYTVRFGKIGTTGQTQVKEFETPARAQAEVAKMVREKLAKGYIEASSENRE